VEANLVQFKSTGQKRSKSH